MMVPSFFWGSPSCSRAPASHQRVPWISEDLGTNVPSTRSRDGGTPMSFLKKPARKVSVTSGFFLLVEEKQLFGSNFCGGG